MNKIFYAIADFFGLIFSGVEAVGNTINYLYIVIIFAFLVIWTIKCLSTEKMERSTLHHKSNPISLRKYLPCKVIFSAFSYDFLSASFIFSPNEVIAITLPPFVFIVSPSCFVPA